LTKLSRKLIPETFYYAVSRLFSFHMLSKTWSLTLREERRLSMFEKRMLRRIFEPKRDEVRGNWRKLHKEELNDL
jgi:hypothetical protein